MQARFEAGEVITAMVTPFDEKRNVDYEALAKLAQYLVENGSDSLLITATTGESPTLTHDEEVEILYCVKSAIGKNAKIIMGTGSNSTQTAVMMSKKAQEGGADAILSVVPYYNKPSQKGIEEHFSKVAQSTDLPVILYNIPSRTGVCIQNETIISLANKYKNIVAIKESLSDLDTISELRLKAPEDFMIYSGDDSLTLPMLSIGATGVVSVASHIVGKEIKSMIHNFKNGNVSVAKNMHLNLFEVFKKLFMLPNPVPVKEALSRLGLINNYVRRPLIEMSEDEKIVLFSAINRFLIKD